MKPISLHDKIEKLKSEIRSETDNYLDAVGHGKTRHEVKEIRNNLTFLQEELERTLESHKKTISG